MQTLDHGWNSPVVANIQKQIANSFVLYVGYKKYHWNVTGPHFRDYHLLFDNHAGEVLGLIDDLGERIRQLGFFPVADLSAYATASECHITTGKQTASEMLQEAVSNHKICCEELRIGIEAAQDAKDDVTMDLLITTKAAHDKMVWFLESTLN